MTTVAEKLKLNCIPDGASSVHIPLFTSFFFFFNFKAVLSFVKTCFCLDVPDFSDAGRMITTSVTAKPSLKNGKQAASSMGDRGSKAGSRTVSSVFNFYFVLQLYFLINTLILHFHIQSILI